MPADEFATTAFWRRLTAAASGHGHDGHEVMLVGQVNPTDVYELRCVRCDRPVVAIRVQR
ncbi:hypothetical protein ACH4T9_13010 [Micromonospora sp. NPDC020750]|uniref:hypothetical protein n=1 Tax=unclassified Micromonospora TaxID=2617518 RepID=UPI0037A71D9D